MTEKLDLKDRKLLYELDLDSRQPISRMAKRIGLSKTAVLYRIGNLRKSGVIKGFEAVVDTGKLGLIGFRLYLRLQGATPAKKKGIIGFLNRSNRVSWLVSIEGDYDIGALVLVHGISEMNAFWKTFLARYNNYIAERNLAIMTKVSYFSRAYLLGLPYNTYEAVSVSEPRKAEIDGTDERILELLVADARMPLSDIAHELGISARTATGRIRELERGRIITGYRTVFDVGKLGYQYFKVMFRLHNASDDKIGRFAGYMKQDPNIIFNDEVLGGDDFEIELQVRDLDELRRILDEIDAKFSGMIRERRIMRYYEEHKYLIPSLGAAATTS